MTRTYENVSFHIKHPPFTTSSSFNTAPSTWLRTQQKSLRNSRPKLFLSHRACQYCIVLVCDYFLIVTIVQSVSKLHQCSRLRCVPSLFQPNLDRLTSVRILSHRIVLPHIYDTRRSRIYMGKTMVKRHGSLLCE